MRNIDYLFDTKAKRQCAIRLLFFFLTCCLVFTYVKTAWILISLDTYDKLYAAWTSSSLDSCYVARFILLSMSSIELQVLPIIKNLILALHPLDIFFLLMVVFVLRDMYFKGIRKLCLCIPLLYLVQFMLIGIMALVASSANSLLMVIGYVRMIGWCIMVLQSVVVLLVVWMSIKTISDYRIALQYEAMEVNEE